MTGKCSARLACAAVLCLSLSAVSTMASAQSMNLPRAELRGTWLASWRSAEVAGADGSRVIGAGLTPLNAAFDGWGWPLTFLGLRAGFRSEAFGLSGAGARGALHHGVVALAARARFGPARLEPTAGWAVDQLPAWFVDGTGATRWASSTRHAVLLGARAGLDVSVFTLDAIASVQLGSGLGFEGRLVAAFRLFRTGPVRWLAVAEAALTFDRGAVPTGQVEQLAARGAAGLGLTFGESEYTAQTGEVLVKVATEEGAPPEGVTAWLEGPAGERLVQLGEDGAALAAGVEPGPMRVKVRCPGYEDELRAVEVRAGATVEAAFVLRPRRVTTGGISVAAVDRRTRQPVAAHVEVSGRTIETGAGGAALLEGLPAGPARVAVSAPGYATAYEAAIVVAGQVAAVPVALDPAGGAEGTVSGMVMSASTGVALRGELSLDGGKQRTVTAAGGTFELICPPGTHTLTASAPEHAPLTKTVTVRAGERLVVQFLLKRR